MIKPFSICNQSNMLSYLFYTFGLVLSAFNLNFNLLQDEKTFSCIFCYKSFAKEVDLSRNAENLHKHFC